jgi:hypothetical protein
MHARQEFIISRTSRRDGRRGVIVLMATLVALMTAVMLASPPAHGAAREAEAPLKSQRRSKSRGLRQPSAAVSSTFSERGKTTRSRSG